MLSMPDTVKEALDLKLAELGQESHAADDKVNKLRTSLREAEVEKSKTYSAFSQFQQYFEGLESNGKITT